MAHLRRRRFASEAVDDDVLDRVRPRRRDVRRVDPESPRHTRTGDETSLLNDRVRPRGIRGVKKKLTQAPSLSCSSVTTETSRIPKKFGSATLACGKRFGIAVGNNRGADRRGVRRPHRRRASSGARDAYYNVLVPGGSTPTARARNPSLFSSLRWLRRPISSRVSARHELGDSPRCIGVSRNSYVPHPDDINERPDGPDVEVVVLMNDLLDHLAFGGGESV